MEANEYYQQGNELRGKMDYDGAVELYSKAIDKDPNSFIYIDSRASVYELQDENDKALADYGRILELDNLEPWALTSVLANRGDLHYRLGNYDKALADMDRCFVLAPDENPSYWLDRARVYYAKGDFDAAIAGFDRELERLGEPEKNSWIFLDRGKAWRDKGDSGKALEDFTRAAACNPANAEAFGQAAYIRFAQGELDEAIEGFSKAIELRGDDAYYWLARGVCYWSQCRKKLIGFWDDEDKGETIGRAEADFTRALELFPEYAEAWFNRGVVRCLKAVESNRMIKSVLTQKVTDEAGRVLMLAQLDHMGGTDLVPQADAVLRGLRSNRDELDVAMSKSFGLFAQKDAMEAVEDLTRSIELDPDQPEAYYQRGLAYGLLGQRDKALADYEQTCALDPDHEKAAGKRDALLESLKESPEKQSGQALPGID